MSDYNKYHIYKINKYKLKFLYSLIEKSSVNNISTYLKKYSYHIDLNNFMVGGTNISIKSNTDLESLLLNIKKLFNIIFGEKISSNIIGEFRSKIKFDDIKYPDSLNLENLVKNIFKEIYSNPETNKLDENMLKQINKIIEETIGKIKLNEPKKKEEKPSEKKSEKTSEKQSETPPESKKKDNWNMLFNPIFIQPQSLYYPYNNNTGLNISISDSTTTDESAKLYDKKLSDNIVIY